MIDQALNDDVFHVAGYYLFEARVVFALVRQMRGAYDYVLDGALEAPAHFLGAWTAARVMVLEIDVVLGGVSPFARERFGPLVHAGFVGDLCKEDGGRKYILTCVYRERRNTGGKRQNTARTDRDRGSHHASYPRQSSAVIVVVVI